MIPGPTEWLKQYRHWLVTQSKEMNYGRNQVSKSIIIKYQ